MNLKDSDLLNLPDAPDFLSEPPHYTMNEMIALCETLLPYWNKQRETEVPKAFVGEPFQLLPESEPPPLLWTES